MSLETAGAAPFNSSKRRNHLLDAIRLTFALLVLLGHAPEMMDGNQSREIFVRLTGTSMTLGGLAVHGFFLLSGALILRSWISDPELGNFLRKRMLRIVPGYVVAVMVSVLVCGLIAPGGPHFFRHLNRGFIVSVATLNSPQTPSVFPGTPYPLVNGSLWTIAYEFRCYLMVALLGVSGLLRRSHIWIALTVLFIAVELSPALSSLVSWSHHLAILGNPHPTVELFAAFFIGGCFVLLESYIPWRLELAVGALLLICLAIFAVHIFPVALDIGGGYLLSYAGKKGRSPQLFAGLPDISYGVYLYGWPVEMLVVYRFHPSPWLVFAVAVPLCCCLGWLSWHFVERPALRWKTKPLAPLPAA